MLRACLRSARFAETSVKRAEDKSGFLQSDLLSFERLHVSARAVLTQRPSQSVPSQAVLLQKVPQRASSDSLATN
jgi:hypothetical protein